MAKPKLTPWFSPDVKPTRKGAYETQRHSLREFSYWNGKRWGVGDWTPQGAREWNFAGSSTQNRRWRGLAEPPKRVKAPAQEPGAQQGQSSAREGAEGEKPCA